MKTFEEKMNRLEEIIDKLQSPEISLSDSVDLFEEGSKLANELYAELGKAQKKISLLVNKSGAPEYAEFSESGEPDEN